MKESQFNLIGFNIWAVCFILLPHDTNWPLRLCVLINVLLCVSFCIYHMWCEHKENKNTNTLMNKTISDIENEIKATINKWKAEEKCEDHPNETVQ